MANVSHDESRVARRVRTTLIPSLNSGPPRTVLIFSRGSNNPPGGYPDETTVDVSEMRSAVDQAQEHDYFIKGSLAQTESVDSDKEMSPGPHGTESSSESTQVDHRPELQGTAAPQIQGRPLSTEQMLPPSESENAFRHEYTGLIPTGIPRQKDSVNSSRVSESTLQPSQIIQADTHEQLQQHVPDTRALQNSSGTIPHVPQKEDVLMSPPPALVGRKAPLSASIVYMGNSMRTGDQGEMSTTTSGHKPRPAQSDDQACKHRWMANPFEEDGRMPELAPLPLSASGYPGPSHTGSLENGSLSYVSTRELENALAALAEGPQAEAPASNKNLGRLYELFRRTRPSYVPLYSASAPPPPSPAPAPPPPTRAPRPPRVVKIQNPPNSANYAGLSSLESSASTIQPQRRVQAPKKYTPKYRLSERKYRDPNTVELQAHVRTVAREYLGRETRTAKFSDGPSRSEKAGAKRGVIAVMFSHYYVSLQNALTRDRKLVEEVFLSHIPAMCKQAQKLDSNTKKVDIGVVDNRRRGRCRERWQTCISEPSLVPISGRVNRIGTDGNSEDESGGEEGPDFTIDPLDWRADDLKTILRSADVVRLSKRFVWDGVKYKTAPGKWPRYRTERSDHETDLNVKGVPGLPRNFYDSEWLLARSEWKLAQLEILDVEVDLSVPEDIQRIVDAFGHIKSRKDRPNPPTPLANRRTR
ncbi:hypothetical protein BC629DRAFT_1599581 [Irpex lacteus]|nr:hypothetical protein BC629DRAFT_1599581 [Irpex lacteus]